MKKFLISCLLIIPVLLFPQVKKTENRQYRLINADQLRMNKFMDEYVTNLEGNVMFYYGKTQFKADYAEIYEQQKSVVLKGNVRIKEDTLTFYADNAYYYRNDEYIRAVGKVKVREDHSDKTYRELTANQIEYYRNKGDMYASQNVLMYEQKQNVYARSGYATYNTNTGYGYMIREPLVWQKNQDDSLSIKAEKIEMFKDTNKLIASFDVQTKSKDMTSYSDFLVYYIEQGKVILVGKPRLRSDFGDAQAENMSFMLVNNKIESATLQDSCKIFFAEEKGKEKLNWISSDVVNVFWQNDKIHHFVANDNVKSYIFQEQKKKQLPMSNLASGSELFVSFDQDQKIDKINLKNSVQGKYVFKRRK